MTDPHGSLFALARSYDENNKQTTHPPHEAIASQTLTARAHFDHMLIEGMKSGDEVLLVPSGLWTAENGALRPGVDALAAHLVGAGVLVTIAPSLCVAHLECLPCSRTHSPHQLLDVHRTYPSLLDGGLLYTADLKGTAARLLSPPVDARALADVTRDVEAQRAHVAATHSAGGKATVASHGPQMANGGKAGGKRPAARPREKHHTRRRTSIKE